MATTKPRITITLSPRQYEVLRGISEYGGQSMSAFVGELLEQSLPVLERMGESLRRIKSVQDEQRKRIADDLENAQAAMEPILDQVIDQYDLFCGKLEASVGAIETDRRAGTLAPTETPATNRGVTPSPITAPNSLSRKASRRSVTPSKTSKSRGV